MEIIPAILPKSFQELEEALSRLQGSAPVVQIDVCDGVFVPNTTWPYTDRTVFETILSEDEGLPFWQDFNFEVDLMVKHALPDVADWVKAGASRIIVHVESEDDRGALEALQEMRALEGRPGVEVAIAISLDTPIEKLESLAHLCSEIQVMGIARIGFQGEAFDERALDRIRELRAKFPEHIIGVDGGVTLENVKSIHEAGATRIAVGSAIQSAPDATEAYEAFVNAVGD